VRSSLRHHFLPDDQKRRASSHTLGLDALHPKQGHLVEPAHLNVIRDNLGNFFVEVAQGADRITLTPPLWSTIEATEALRRIASATGLLVGRTP
jgi:hypothetical protein